MKMKKKSNEKSKFFPYLFLKKLLKKISDENQNVYAIEKYAKASLQVYTFIDILKLSVFLLYLNFLLCVNKDKIVSIANNYRIFPIKKYSTTNYFPNLSKERKKVRIMYVEGTNRKNFYFQKYIDEVVDVTEVDNNPDYIIATPTSRTNYHDRYKKSIKICYTKDEIPDFNDYDYGIGSASMQFLDRFLRYPDYLMRSSIYRLPKTRYYDKNKFKKFCGSVFKYDMRDWRKNFTEKLNEYKKVEYKEVGDDDDNLDERVDFLSKYKFGLAFEKASAPGYNTEKLFDVFLSGAIPIYFGDDYIFKAVNEDALVYLKDECNIDNVINYIKEIDNNDQLAKSMIKVPILKDDNYFEKQEKKVRNFIYNIFDQDKKHARRIGRNNE